MESSSNTEASVTRPIILCLANGRLDFVVFSNHISFLYGLDVVCERGVQSADSQPDLTTEAEEESACEDEDDVREVHAWVTTRASSYEQPSSSWNPSTRFSLCGQRIGAI